MPNPNKDLGLLVHAELIPKNGIYNHENLDFTTLIADGKYQFVYIFSPARSKARPDPTAGRSLLPECSHSKSERPRASGGVLR